MKDKLLKIINHFGIKNQQRKLAEESFELLEAISCDDGTIVSLEHILDEIADNMVLLKQIQYFYNIDNSILEAQIEKKVDRTLKRIKTNYYALKGEDSDE